MDFNQLADALAELVADKVVAKLAKQNGTDWPEVETKTAVEDFEEVKSGFVRTVDKLGLGAEVKVDEPVEQEVPAEDKPVKLANSPVDKRKADLMKVDVRNLRRDFAAVEGGDPSDYTHLEKSDLVKKIVDFELLTGHTLQEELDEQLKSKGLKVAPSPEEIPDDDTPVDDEPDDDDSESPLTREGALELDLATLKKIAIENDIPAADLKGLDVEAVVDLLYGVENDEDVVDGEVEKEDGSDAEGSDEGEDGDPSLANELQQMSIAELRGVANEAAEQGISIEYDRSTSREELIEKLLKVIG